MDGNRDGRDPFSPSSALKLEHSQQSNTPPGKRPRQKGLHFDLPNVQQQTRHDGPPDCPMPLPSASDTFVQSNGDMLSAGASGWCHDVPHFPRHDTPVPEPEDVMMTDDPPPPPPPVSVSHWLRRAVPPHRHPRPLQQMERFAPRKPHEECPIMMEHHASYPMETLEDRMASSPFSAVGPQAGGLMHFMNFQQPQGLTYETHQRPGMTVVPPSPARKGPAQPGLFGMEGPYTDDFSSAFAPPAKEWGGNCKEAETALAGPRLRQPRRPRPPGLNRDLELGPYLSRQNGLFDFGYAPDAATVGHSSGRASVARERLRRIENRQNSLEDRREHQHQQQPPPPHVWPRAISSPRSSRTMADSKEARATAERHRARQQSRDRRSSCRGNEFGALMNVLGLVPDDDAPPSARDSSSGISRVREAMFGIVSSRLPPHLLFSDRDFDGDDYEFLCRLDDTVESKKGADDMTINKINLCSFGSIGGASKSFSETEPRCPICLENFAEGAELRVMPCHHQYHRSCLDKWLKIKAVCPICNMNIKDKFLEDAKSTDGI